MKKTVQLFAAFLLLCTFDSSGQTTEELLTLPELYFAVDLTNGESGILSSRTYYHHGAIELCGETFQAFGRADEQSAYLLKVEGDKVYIGHHCDSMSLTYDFSLQIDDVFTINDEQYTVVARETIQLLDGLDRAKITLHQINGHDEVEWINGIGHAERGLLEVADPSEYWTRLVCAGYRDNHTYIHSGYSEEECLMRSCRSAEISFEVIADDDMISINNQTLFADSFYWDFGDGNFSTEVNPIHTYAERGCYQITVNAVTECNNVVERRYYHDYCMDSLWQAVAPVDTVRHGHISFPTDDVGYAVSFGQLFKTTDGGTNWSSIQVPPVSNGDRQLVMVEAINEDTLLVTSNGYGEDNFSMLVSFDGGANWLQRIPDEFLYAIHCNDDGLCAAGSLYLRGVYISTDFGLTWTLKTTSHNIDWYRFLWLNDGTLIATGTDYVLPWGNPLIGFSNDAGESWSIDTLVEYDRSLYFIDRQTGWIGNRGKIYKTENGGETWTASPIKDMFDILAIFFVDDDRGWAAGTRLYGTHDGGQTWQLEQCIRNPALNFDWTIDGSLYFSSGTNGLFKYMDDGLTSCHSSVTSIDDKKPIYTIFPNPTNDVVHIEAKNYHDEINVTLLDIQGRLMLTKSTSSPTCTLDLSSLPKGMYIVHIKTKDQSHVSSYRVVKH